MSAPVEVLVVMDSLAKLEATIRGTDARAVEEIREARAAVAELIEAAEAAHEWLASYRIAREDRAKLRAALARVRGAA